MARVTDRLHTRSNPSPVYPTLPSFLKRTTASSPSRACTKSLMVRRSRRGTERDRCPFGALVIIVRPEKAFWMTCAQIRKCSCVLASLHWTNTSIVCKRSRPRKKKKPRSHHNRAEQAWRQCQDSNRARKMAGYGGELQYYRNGRA